MDGKNVSAVSDMRSERKERARHGSGRRNNVSMDLVWLSKSKSQLILIATQVFIYFIIIHKN